MSTHGMAAVLRAESTGKKISPKLRAIASGRQGTSGPPHCHPTLTGSCSLHAQGGQSVSEKAGGAAGEATDTCAPGGHHPVKQSLVPSSVPDVQCW